MKNSDANSVPRISAATLRFFATIVRRYFRRHFRAVSIQHAQQLRSALQGPLIVYANHASWWDPMVSVLLAQTLLPRRPHFAPMDAVPLARYPILQRVGVFPIDLGTTRGAVQFLRRAEAILRSGGVLWVTPQGRFADVREPLAFKQGLAALAARVPGTLCLPLAIEYTFWNERLPETLLRFGAPVQALPGESTERLNSRLEAALAETMAALRVCAMARDPKQFAVLVEGGRGTGGMYALWQRLRQRVKGRRLAEDHSARESSMPADGAAGNVTVLGPAAGDAASPR